MTEPPVGSSIGYLQLLRNNRDFRHLWLAEVISFLGDWFNTIALYTAVAELSGSTEAVSLAIQLAGQQLESQITADDQKRLAADFLSAVETGGSTEVANG